MAIACACALMAAAPGMAFAQKIRVVRDAEIEGLVHDYARPIFKAAGIEKSGIDIVLVNDPSFNAFVGGHHLFINTGALMKAHTPNEIIGVLAHEAGHIAAGHEEKLRDEIGRLKRLAIVTSLLGMAATAAGAATGSRGLAGVGGGLAIAGPGVAARALLQYRRDQEYTADRAAVLYLDRTHQSAKGLLDTLKRFDKALILSGTEVDPYLQDHPMPRDRVSRLETLAKASPYFSRADPPELQLRHELARAKIAAFTGDQRALLHMFRADPQGLPARYGEAITAFLHGEPSAAMQKVEGLLKAAPRNPYFHELRGDVLMRANRPAEAANAYRRAIRLNTHKSGLIEVSYGRALLAAGGAANARRAVAALKRSLGRDREYPTAYQFLAQAYGRLGDIPSAELATADQYFYSGDYRNAHIFAVRAQKKLKSGSPDWLRAQDIINYRPVGDH